MASKKKAKPVSVDSIIRSDERASEFIRSLVSQRGRRIIKKKRPIGRIRSGIISLDYALGGGLPAGKITSFYGEKSGGKSTTALRFVAAAQSLCAVCLRRAEIREVVPDGSDEDARWRAVGCCDCVKSGIAEPPIPEKDPGMKVQEYSAMVRDLQEQLQENSYQELVCLWIDVEDYFDEEWASKLGVDVRRLELLAPESAEEAIDTVTMALESGAFGLVVLDSIAQLTPDKEYTATSEEWQQGLAARLLNKAFRKWITGMRKAKDRFGNEHVPTLIMINQVRDKIGVMYGDPTTKPGGKGQEFAASVELKFLSSKVEKEEESFGSKTEGEKVDVPVREKIRFRVTKNRTSATVGAEGFYVQLNRGNDEFPAGYVMQDEFIMKMALKYVIQKKSGKYIAGDREFASQVELLEAIRFDEDFRSALVDTLLNVAKERKL